MARRAYEGAPLFRLLVAPGSEVTALPIWRVSRSVWREHGYSLSGRRMLVQAGLNPDDVVYESVPAIPHRFGLMMEGHLGAAILPDPLAQAAIEAARADLDDTMFVEQQFSQSVLSFRNASLDEKPDTVRAFLRAWTRAVEALNADPESFRALWLANVSVPDSVKETYVIPPFPIGENTTEAVWEDVSNWLLERGIIEQAASYADSVDNSFLTTALTREHPYRKAAAASRPFDLSTVCALHHDRV
jgi:NitT/TauT family transport system substrate-binding protein